MNIEEIKTNLRGYYNREAAHRNSGEKRDWKLRLRERFCDTVLEENKKTLVELGAGTGQDSRYFMDRGLDVLALDLSGEMVKACEEKNINALELDFYSLPSIGRKFDCVWAMNSLLHVPKADLKKVLAGVDSALNEGGLFFMGVYGGEDTESNWVNEISEVPRFFSYHSETGLKKILRELFTIISFDQFDVGRNIDFQSILMRKK